MSLTSLSSDCCLTASVRLSCVQRQVSGEVRMQPQGSLVDPIAMTMATVGMGVSLYSARQMAERVHLKHLSAWGQRGVVKPEQLRWAGCLFVYLFVYVGEGLWWRRWRVLMCLWRRGRKIQVSQKENVSHCEVPAGRFVNSHNNLQIFFFFKVSL